MRLLAPRLFALQDGFEPLEIARALIGLGGGHLVAEGTPEAVAQIAGSYTGAYLRPYLERAAEKARKRA